jgi:hypothetical protein
MAHQKPVAPAQGTKMSRARQQALREGNMNYERRVLLSLVAAGRITAAEAERLILAWENPAWQDARDWVWVAVACVAGCLLQAHPHVSFDGLIALLHGFAVHGTKVLHTAASIGFKRMGGSV